jgi:hypothetical protein
MGSENNMTMALRSQALVTDEKWFQASFDQGCSPTSYSNGYIKKNTNFLIRDAIDLQEIPEKGPDSEGTGSL